MKDNNFYTFYKWLFFTSSLPFIAYIFPFMSGTIFGFNITGWAWFIMLIVGVYYSLQQKNNHFPLHLWIPWVIYITAHLLLRYTNAGLQLSLQYLLPILLGIVASGFKYDDSKYRWLFKTLAKLSGFVVTLFIFGRLFRGGYTPQSAATPMLISIIASLFIGMFYITNYTRYAIIFSTLMLVPVIDMTRMGIVVFLTILILHLANKNIVSKIIMGVIGLLLATLIMNMDTFKKKTLVDSDDTVEFSDIKENIDYYQSDKIQSSGRKTWYKMLEPGLEKNPYFGHGPRADGEILSTFFKGEHMGEAHNDYLSVRYNYGYIGLSLLLFGIVATYLSMYKIWFVTKNQYQKLLVSSTMTLTFGYLLFMYTDNILKYTIFFPNIYYAMIGIIYAQHSKK